MEAAKDVALVRVREIEGKGRALVATQSLRAGQTVLRDSPILLYSAFPLTTTTTTVLPQQQQQRDLSNCYCSNCFRVILLHQSSSTPPPPLVVSCPRCSSFTNFCSPKCLSIALASSHTPWVCQALCRLRPLLQHHPLDRQLQARFLVAAYNLASVSPSDFQTLLSLQGECCLVDDASLFLHSLISSLSPPPLGVGGGGLEFSPQLTAALLAKDKLNAFGLMEPFAQDRERSVRAYGIYPRTSFFNHDCLPNACRFDYLDHHHHDAASAKHSSTTTTTITTTDLIIRMIHDVPQGREICLSYFPVNLKYSDRQRRLREDYGFTCDCDRCKVEANWSEDEEEEEAEAMDEDRDQEMGEMDSETESSGGGGGVVVKEKAAEEEGNDDFPHAYFFLRYMCNRNNCWGTLAPLPPTDDATPSTMLECNVCGNYDHVTTSPNE